MNITFKLNVIVCLCRAVSHREIDREIDSGARSVDDVGKACGAGTGCGKCRQMIHERIEAASGDCNGCHDCPMRRRAATAA